MNASSNDEITDKAATIIIDTIRPTIEENIQSINPDKFSDLKDKIINKINSIFDDYQIADELNNNQNENIDQIQPLDEENQNENRNVEPFQSLSPIDEFEADQINEGINFRNVIYVIISLLIFVPSVYYIIVFANKKRREPSGNKTIRPLFETAEEERSNNELKSKPTEKSTIISDEIAEDKKPLEIIKPKTYGQALLDNNKDVASPVAFTIFSEKIANKGEDSNPILAKIT